ncbi:MAG TPA: alkaline phosphatase family protein [Nitrospiraceae bacterium]|nr:alkaline phosphatase family protein [Nitrospiraceae bacterium]
MLWKLIFGTVAVPVAVGVGILSAASAVGNNAPTLPRPDHIVIVIEENHSYSQIIDSPNAPYLNKLAAQGAVFTQSFGITYPSQPNYLALFAGSTQGITDNSCPHTFTTPNLGHALLEAGLTFAGYSEDLPSVGPLICSEGLYTRKHNPWVNWQDSVANGLPASANVPLTDFPTEYSMLPTVSMIVPNQVNDMHHGNNPEAIQTGDRWLREHLEAYVQWAKQHNSLLIVTWDEDNKKENNRIATLFVGPMVQAGRYGQRITHYNVLRTIEDLYGLPHAGASADAAPITEIWKPIPRS